MIKFRRILKEVKEDKKNRSVAKDIYQNMIEYLSNGREIDVKPSTDPHKVRVCISLSDFHPNIMTEYYPVEICFYDRPHKGTSAEFLWGGVNGSKLKMYHVDFEIFFQNKEIMKDSPVTLEDVKSSSSFQEDFAKSIASDFEMTPEIRNTFFEEVHHYLDYARTEGDIKFGNEGEYYTRDTEVNAKLQSAITSFENDILDGATPNLPPELEFQNEWETNFESFKDWFFDRMLSNEFVNSLNDDQYKSVINRLYQFWEDKVKQ